MTAIVDYDTGNLRSVYNALGRIGAEYQITDNPDTIRRADHVLLPGVGEASSAMEKLRERHLEEVIKSLTQPVLGICIGMQLMCQSSEEGNAQCMGIFPNKVKKFRIDAASDEAHTIKVPHMGWNQISSLKTPLFDNIKENSFLYFVHSFAADVNTSTIALCSNGTEFSAALNRDNFFGTQFHPEKSGSIGEQILRNFISL